MMDKFNWNIPVNGGNLLGVRTEDTNDSLLFFIGGHRNSVVDVHITGKVLLLVET